jgi:hypothetical protein
LLSPHLSTIFAVLPHCYRLRTGAGTDTDTADATNTGESDATDTGESIATDTGESGESDLSTTKDN